MSWSFRRRVSILPDLRLNFSKTGVSATIGVRGASVTVGKKGTYLNTGISGTGIYSRKKISGPTPKRSKKGTKIQAAESAFDQSLIDQVIPNLLMSVTDVNDEGEGSFFFSYAFECKVCGCSKISVPDDEADDGMVKCPQCGVEHSSFETIKTVGNYLGQFEVKRRGLKPAS